MIILWNSAGMVVELTLVDDTGTQTSYEGPPGRTLARDMLAYLRDRLAEHGKTLADITGIGARSGPGSFTGLRIGLTVLNTLAHEQHIPIVGAMGDDWRTACLERLAHGEDDNIVLPQYGAAAHITQPKK